MKHFLTSEVLVFSLEGFDSVIGFLELSLGTVQFSGVAAGFLLGVFNFSLEVAYLSLPFGNGLVEITLFLLQVVGIGVGPFHIYHKILKFTLESRLGLLKLVDLLVSGLSGAFCLLQFGLEFAFGILKLFSTSHAFAFVLAAPCLSLSVSTRKLSLDVSLGFLFLLELFAEAVEVRGEVADFALEFLTGL